MPDPPTTEKPPSQWAAIIDYSKTVITLSVALLGLTVTFAEKLLPVSPTAYQAGILNWAWILLVASLLSGVLAVAFSISYLRKGCRDSGSIFCANLAFFTLVGAGALLLLLGFSRSQSAREHWTTVEVLREATTAISSLGVDGQEYRVQSLEWVDAYSRYEIRLVAPSDEAGFNLSIDPVEKMVTRIRAEH